MLKIPHVCFLLGMLLYPLAAPAEMSVSIGIDLPVYPNLAQIPGYPVYYAPELDANFFFYDGMYWVYQDDEWYTSSWYNGPWWYVSEAEVPVFLLRIPVRYYRQPPEFFIGWRNDAPPRWGEHWGRDWEQHRNGWDRWDRRVAPAPAPLPDYQRQYSRDRYPAQVRQQQQLQQQHYPFNPREPVARQYDQGMPSVQHAEPGRTPDERGARQDFQRRQSAPDSSRPQAPAGVLEVPRQQFQTQPALPPKFAVPDERGARQDFQRRQSPPDSSRPPAPAGVLEVPRQQFQTQPAPPPKFAVPDERGARQDFQRRQNAPDVSPHEPQRQTSPVQPLPQRGQQTVPVQNQTPVQHEQPRVQENKPQGKEVPHEHGQERARDRND